MNLHPPIYSKVLAALCGITLGAGIFAFRAQADPWDKKTVLTVDKTIQVTDRVLPAGTYVLKLAESSSNRHIVQIFNADQSRIIDTILAIPNYRLQPTGKSRFSFWETPPGAAPALRAWFYPGDNFGQEFAYPKHLAMLQTVQQTEQTRIMNQEKTATEESKRTEETEVTQSADREAPPPVETQQEQKVEETVEMAQNNPPPAPAPAAETAAPVETQRQLPKTASPFPLVGLGGMLSLGLGGLLRLARRT